MIRHQTVYVTNPTVPRNHIAEDLQKSGPVFVIKEDIFSHIPAAGDVIDSAFVF